MRGTGLLVALMLSCSPGVQVDAGVLRDAGAVERDSGDAPMTMRCDVGTVACGSACADTQSSLEHCGECGRRCEGAETCFVGRCSLDCPAPERNCRGSCVFVERDVQNCGACGVRCPEAHRCTGGVCVPVSGLAVCAGQVVDTLTSSAHCGGCDAGCSAPRRCSAGACCRAQERGCDGGCIDVSEDVANCGGCALACPTNEVCRTGRCQACPSGQQRCENSCFDLARSAQHCGGCGRACGSGEVCVGGACTCNPSLVRCGASCVDPFTDVTHCGSCSAACSAGALCQLGACVPGCPAGQARCGDRCVDVLVDVAHCGACGVRCGAGEQCLSGACTSCTPDAGVDCDGDGFTLADGDCCDVAGACGAAPERVNPGAVEFTNGVDDNCNGLVDQADQLDLGVCDQGLASNASSANDAVAALGLCRSAVPGSRTWGVLEASWRRADGTPLLDARAHSLRTRFGQAWTPQAGAAMVVLSSGVASDATQTAPGPNGGPSLNQSAAHMPPSVSLLATCSSPACVRDWLTLPNPPLKLAQRLPESPICGSPSMSAALANDSVMLFVRLRAPTNARGFSVRGAFFSVEYPEFVCTEFNDQFIVLVDTPAPTWPQPNPPDKNLMTYRDGPLRFPIAVNIAASTSIFEACEPPGRNSRCNDVEVSSRSCAQGLGPLQGTGFEARPASACALGAATRWLTTRGNVTPGQEVTLRFVLWDVGDSFYDSTALLDAFRWESAPQTPGTD